MGSVRLTTLQWKNLHVRRMPHSNICEPCSKTSWSNNFVVSAKSSRDSDDAAPKAHLKNQSQNTTGHSTVLQVAKASGNNMSQWCMAAKHLLPIQCFLEPDLPYEWRACISSVQAIMCKGDSPASLPVVLLLADTCAGQPAHDPLTATKIQHTNDHLHHMASTMDSKPSTWLSGFSTAFQHST